MTSNGDYAPSPSPHVREQVAQYEASGGTEGNTMQGLPVIILTTRGARTGMLRKTPLMRVEHDGDYAIVASKGGAPENPLWYYNVRAHPDVELQDGPAPRHMRARQVSGQERALWWQRSVEAFPPYAGYQTKTSRRIPVFVLEPLDG